jgi:hypothetical protein
MALYDALNICKANGTESDRSGKRERSGRSGAIPSTTGSGYQGGYDQFIGFGFFLWIDGEYGLSYWIPRDKIWVGYHLSHRQPERRVSFSRLNFHS